MWLEDVRPEKKNGLDALIHMQEGAIGNHDLEFESDITDTQNKVEVTESEAKF